MEADWDLHAVVRGCATAAATNTTTSSSSSSSSTITTISNSTNVHQVDNFICFQDSFEPKFDTTNVVQELHNLYEPFVIGELQDLSIHQTLKQQQKLHNHQLITGLIQPKHFTTSKSSASRRISHAQMSPRIQKRKNKLKKVCQVPAEAMSSDKWAWRKYGQKPIKGSPYPRGYYKCSSSKGCLARKQVDRNRSDPNMFNITYTSEHNHPMPTHRSSLAGIARQKPVNSKASSAGDTNKPTTSSPACLSPVPENQECSKEDKEDSFN
ncbi:WRKY transcription factor 22-like [Nicotiana sylvestris]|uniref:WRKY transcription factor 22-like n=1 Tax=Nicotiana sylvestris TaxID=4096 RepID=A0A1U7XUW9_NICSY|nr:PREDICTED: WRKY transcription factor 22-like [Nicotiana sylvestris]